MEGQIPIASWSGGETTEDITNISAGNYNVVITDVIGCTKTASVLITQPAAALSSSVTNQIDVSCNGGNNGSATITSAGGTPGYTYAWNNGKTSSTITALSSGGYSVTISDANGCSTNQNVTITEPPQITVTVTTVDVSCNGGNNGNATASASGGTGSFTYSWNTTPIQTTASITNLAAGTYILTVKDSNSCVNTATATIVQPPVLSSSVSITNASSCSSNDGSATPAVSGGTAPYSYSWSNSATTSEITGLAPGSYTVAITDAAGCSDTAIAVVSCPNGFDEHYLQNEFSVYPNPSSGIFYLVFNQNVVGDKFELNISNVIGESIYSTSDINSLLSNEINLGSQPRGVYFLKIINEDGSAVVKKIIKE